MSEELKACPLCGGEAKLMDMGYPHWVYCTKCGAKVHGGTNDPKDSVDAWNRRTLPNEDILSIVRLLSKESNHWWNAVCNEIENALGDVDEEDFQGEKE